MQFNDKNNTVDSGWIHVAGKVVAVKTEVKVLESQKVFDKATASGTEKIRVDINDGYGLVGTQGVFGTCPVRRVGFVGIGDIPKAAWEYTIPLYLKADYLKTLPVGRYYLTVDFNTIIPMDYDISSYGDDYIDIIDSSIP